MLIYNTSINNTIWYWCRDKETKGIKSRNTPVYRRKLAYNKDEQRAVKEKMIFSNTDPRLTNIYGEKRNLTPIL